MGELVCKGAGRLYVYSISNLIGSVMLIISILGLLTTGVAFSTTLAFGLASRQHGGLDGRSLDLASTEVSARTG